MKFFIKTSLLIVFFVFSINAIADTHYSRLSAGWGTSSTWSNSACGGSAASAKPAAGDNITVCSGYTISGNTSISIAVLTVSGVLNIEAGITITATTIIINAGGVINNNGTIKLNGTFTNNGTFNEGFLTVVGNSTAAGIFNNNASANLNILSTGQLYVGYSSSRLGTLNNSGTITNSSVSSSNPGITLRYGTISNSSIMVNNIGTYAISYSGTTLTNNASGTITNNGSFTMNGTFTNKGNYNERHLTMIGNSASAILNNNAGANFNIQSTGTGIGGQLSIGSLANGFSASINNSGTMTNSCPDSNYTGIFLDYGTITNSGAIINNVGAYMYNHNGTVNITSGFSITNYGTFINFYLVYVNGTFTNYGKYKELWGTVVGNTTSGVFNNNIGASYTIDASNGIQLLIGTSSSIIGAFNNKGTLTNNAINENGIIVSHGTLENTGIINNGGGNWYFNGSSIVFQYYGVIVDASGILNNSGSINNSGTFEVLGGGVFNNNINGTYNSSAYTSITGSTINANFNNFGTYNEDFETFLSSTGSGSGLLTNKSGGNINITDSSVICLSSSKGALINEAGGTLTNSGVYPGFPGLLLKVAGTSLINYGSVIGRGNILMNGSFINYSTFDYYMSNGSISGSQNIIYGANGTLIYHGNLAQTTSTFEFSSLGVPNLIINNSSVAGVTLSQPGTINNKLTLVNGLVNSDAINILTIVDNATVSTDGINTEPGSATSFVNGPVKKTGTSSFTFPIGDVSASNELIWAPAGIASHLSSGITAEYYFANYGNTTGASNMCDPTALDHVSSIEHWLLTSNNAFPAVTLHWKNAIRSNITSPSDLVVSHWETCNGTNKWASKEGTVSDNTGSGFVTSTTVLTSYSPFTLGTKNKTNPLPVNILSFEAECNNGKVITKWTTMTETNNDYFSLERSIDAENWSVIATIDGAGNSNEILKYQYTDEQSIGGVSYYRLRQTDFNGQFEVFSPVSVVCSKESTDQLSIYPNPFKSDLVIQYANLAEGKGSVKVVDMLGNIVVENEINVFSGNNNYLLGLQKLSIGLYNIQFTSGNTEYSKRVLKN